MAIRTTNEYSAISPSMKDQWSGKILSRKTRPPLAMPRRSSSSLTIVADPAVGTEGLACFDLRRGQRWRSCPVLYVVVRSQKPGPTAWS